MKMLAQNDISNVLLVADLRGRDLFPLMDGVNKKLQFQVNVFPGARISQLVDWIKQAVAKVNNPTFDLIVVFGGICNITKITYMPYRAAIPQAGSAEELLKSFEEDCDLLDEIRTAAPILLTPIVGINLVHYAGQWSGKLYESQPLVDEVTMMINRYIKRRNSSRGLPTPNTASCIHRCRGKDRGYRTHYQKLFDGCHPVDEVKAIWADAIINTCQQILLDPGQN